MKRNGEEATDHPSANKKQKREFDFTKHPKRKIALTFFYYGWLHDGLVQQTNSQNTVEHHLEQALLKTKLIEDWSTCEFSRCGRTDKGVSAFRQVAACVVRSASPSEFGAFWPDTTEESIKESYKGEEELPYLKMLNGCLPSSIRVTAWAPVERDFTARHACTLRTYKYSMPRANLNVEVAGLLPILIMKEAMRVACSYLVGQHDFRNFCQVDNNEARVTMSYVREIFEVEIKEVSGDDGPSSTSLIELTVAGSGFLWHMIRFIVAVLVQVGARREEPEIVKVLLDVERTPRRPQYALAADTPLCLFDCTYDKSNLNWVRDDLVTQNNLASLQKVYADMATKCHMLKNMMDEVTKQLENPTNVFQEKGLVEFTQAHPWSSKYIPFAQRKTCDSLEEKQEKLRKKKEAEGEM